jgi:NAD(P)-dependent dehydrogenase (short-subunit alcohol dehydrogenase family)
VSGPLAGRGAIVTGAAAGIGAATARALAGAGAKVAVLDREPEGGARVAEEIGGLFVEIDLLRLDSIPAAVETALGGVGPADVLVNAAGMTGYPEPTTLLELGAETWDRVLTVNLKAPFLLMQLVARQMVENGLHGRIVNVSSSSAHRAASMPAYSASKAGLEQLTRSAAAELGPNGINVNCVAPGLTRTAIAMAHHGETLEQRLTGPRANLLNRVSEPEDVAAAILFLCLPESRQITAQTIHTSAGAVV